MSVSRLPALLTTLLVAPVYGSEILQTAIKVAYAPNHESILCLFTGVLPREW